MSQGWGLSWRKLKDWEWYNVPHMAHLFQHLFREANHEPQKGQGVMIKRGQLITGRKKLSFETGIPEQTLRTCIKRLISTSEITIESTSHYSVITICNYEAYQKMQADNNQAINQLFNQQLTSNQPATNQQLTTNNNVNNVNNENNENNSCSRYYPSPDNINNKINSFAEKLIKHWNDKCLIKCESIPEQLAVQRQFAATKLTLPQEELLTAIDYYAEACALPDSQAFKKQDLYHWLLKGHFNKFMPGQFNIEHYRGSNFNRGEPAKDAKPPAAKKGADGLTARERYLKSQSETQDAKQKRERAEAAEHFGSSDAAAIA